jgi:Aspartate-semialdehyde dehydrogenase
LVFVLALNPLMNTGISDTVLTTFQSVSGSGTPGTPFLEISGNIIPHIEGEENKIEMESGKIFGDIRENIIIPKKFDVSVTTTRVPVSVGHLLSISTKVEGDLSYDQVVDLFKKYKNGQITGSFPSLPHNSVEYMDDEFSPQPARDSEFGNYVNEMQVKIGRVRLKGRRINYIALVNNLTRGAAGASLLNAEIATKEEGIL